MTHDTAKEGDHLLLAEAHGRPSVPWWQRPFSLEVENLGLILMEPYF